MSSLRLILAAAVATVAMLLTANPAQSAEKIEVVPHKKVCMVTNALFTRDQIPVKVEGKTYYGCCENCKKTLSEDVSARMATDPVSKKSVDKAKAVIGARQDGTVVYFENEANLKKFAAESKAKN